MNTTRIWGGDTCREVEGGAEEAFGAEVIEVGVRSKLETET